MAFVSTTRCRKGEVEEEEDEEELVVDKGEGCEFDIFSLFQQWYGRVLCIEMLRCVYNRFGVYMSVLMP